MYFFFHLTIKSPERPRWYHSAVFIGSPVYVLRITYRKASQILWSQWLFFCVLNNTHFFETSHRNQKNFMMSGKVGRSANKMVYAKGTFLLWGFCVPRFRAIAYVIDKQSGTCRIYLLLQGLYVSSIKATTCVCNRFNTSFCTKDHKAH